MPSGLGGAIVRRGGVAVMRSSVCGAVGRRGGVAVMRYGVCDVVELRGGVAAVERLGAARYSEGRRSLAHGAPRGPRTGG